MRTNNSKVKNIIISTYFVLIVLAIFSAFVFSSFRYLTPDPILTFVLVILFFVLIFILVHRVSKYFEYDSDGAKVIIINRGLLLSDHFNYREHIVEFEKQDLIAYKFNNYLINKTLSIYLKDKRTGKRKETFNITLVPRKKRKYIRQSLNKMVKQNQQNTDSK